MASENNLERSPTINCSPPARRLKGDHYRTTASLAQPRPIKFSRLALAHGSVRSSSYTTRTRLLHGLCSGLYTKLSRTV
eukprot:2948563-Rhodomonas_salina.3